MPPARDTDTAIPVPTSTPDEAYPAPVAPELPTGYPVETPESFALPAGEVPQKFLDIALDDLVSQTGADRVAVSVLSAEAITWPDGSLGCPQPDTMYTQALVDGYRIVLGLGEEKFNYHLSDTGAFVLCDIPLLDDGNTE
jgi:hypothetical protein